MNNKRKEKNPQNFLYQKAPVSYTFDIWLQDIVSDDGVFVIGAQGILTEDEIAHTLKVHFIHFHFLLVEW